MAVAVFGIILEHAGCAPAGNATPGITYNLGHVLVDEPKTIRHDFRVVNTTGKAVVIVEVRKTCSCTSAKLAKDHLAPGEETTLELVAHLPQSYSDTSLLCSLVTDEPRARTWDYSLKYCSVPPIVAAPLSINLGSFRRSDLDADRLPLAPPIEEIVRIDTFGRAGDSIQPPVVADVPGVRARVEEDPTAEAAGSLGHKRYILRVSLDPAAALADGRSRREILIDGDGLRSVVSANWVVAPPLKAAPSHITFGVVRPGELKTTRALISSVGGRPFRILEARSDSDDAGRIDIAKPTPDGVARVVHPIAIEFRPPGREERRLLSGTLRLTTDDPDQRVLDVPWSALLQPAESTSNGASRVDRPRSREEDR